MAAYKIACQAGISPVEFWNMTPYLTREAVRAIHDADIEKAWTQAALIRTKKLPKLNEMKIKEKNRESMEMRLKDAFRGHNTRTGR